MLVAIVDDDFYVRRALARLVRSHGVLATLFGSAEEFLAASRDVTFALLVLSG
jgi:FixJ family two-component response regulator